MAHQRGRLLAQRALAAAAAAAHAMPLAVVCEQLFCRAAQFSSSSSSSSSAAAMSYSVAQLASRGVISIQGEEAVDFLQVRPPPLPRLRVRALSAASCFSDMPPSIPHLLGAVHLTCWHRA